MAVPAAGPPGTKLSSGCLEESSSIVPLYLLSILIFKKFVFNVHIVSEPLGLWFVIMYSPQSHPVSNRDDPPTPPGGRRKGGSALTAFCQTPFLCPVGGCHTQRGPERTHSPSVAIMDPSGDGQKVAELSGLEPAGNKGKQRAWSFKAGAWGRLRGVTAAVPNN